MENRLQVISVWDNRRDYIARTPTSHESHDISEFLAAMFCPGPFYYYVFNFASMEFEFLSDQAC